jgi:hypothetical protein
VTEYIVNYDCERYDVFTSLYNTFEEYNNFQGCGVRKICLPKGVLLLSQHSFGYPVETDENLHLGQFAIIMETFPKKEKTEPKDDSDVYYIVTLNEQGQDKLRGTTVAYRFCAKAIQHSPKMIFELNSPTKALVIIPFGWIESMAPSKVHWEERKK